MKYLLIALLFPFAAMAQTQKIEAEAFTGMAGIQTEVTADSGAGKNVGYIDAKDYLEYTPAAALTAGNYLVSFRIASTATSSFTFSVAGKSVSTVSIPNTGGYQNWQTISIPVTLPAGKPLIRITAITPLWNINWFSLTYQPPVLVEVPEKEFSFNFETNKMVITYQDGSKTDSIAMPARPVKVKQ